MPVGHPKDPAAHAAVLATNREKRQAAVATKLGIKPVKRAYKRRNWTHPSSEILSETNTVVTKRGNVVKTLEKKIEDLELKLDLAMRSNEHLRDRAVDLEWRLNAVLDLVARVDLRKLAKNSSLKITL